MKTIHCCFQSQKDAYFPCILANQIADKYIKTRFKPPNYRFRKWNY